MAKYQYSRLQNGSDIRGVALEGVAGETVNLDCEAVSRLAKGFLYWLTLQSGKAASQLTISVGRDPRLSGEALSKAFCQALLPYGVRVLDAGLASTPAMFMSTIFEEYRCDGAVMITASHLPWNRNGLKFFSADGGLDKGDITDIITFAESDSVLNSIGIGGLRRDGVRCGGASAATASREAGTGSYGCAGPGAGAASAATASREAGTGSYGCAGPGAGAASAAAASREAGGVTAIPLMETYAAHLRQLIIAGTQQESVDAGASTQDKPLAGMRITVDAGNGSGGFYAEKVLAPLGADVSSSQFLEPDGSFPNHAPNPEDKKAMDAICAQVQACGSHLGLIFDTDVDRSSAVDEHGREINRNGIVAMAAALIAEEHPGTTVVTDSITSNQLTAFLENALGLHHLRFKRGYRNVINKAAELNAAGHDSQLAIETSGHAAYKENYFLDDGAYLATKIVIRAAKLFRQGKGISSVIADLAEPIESVEIRLPILAADFGTYGDQIIDDLQVLVGSGQLKGAALVEPNYEGVRINFDLPALQGWLLLRKSLHDPIMPLNIASDTPGGCDEIRRTLKPLLAGYNQLDSSKL